MLWCLCNFNNSPAESSMHSSQPFCGAVHCGPLGGALPPLPHRGPDDDRMAEAGGPESTAARCPDESSDSEPEQEPGSPQKLIRKVSTSGQIRSKVWGGHTGGVYSGISVVIQRSGPSKAPGCSALADGTLVHQSPEEKRALFWFQLK